MGVGARASHCVRTRPEAVIHPILAYSPPRPFTAADDAAYGRRLRALGLAGNPNKAPEGTDRRLYDTYGRAADIMPVHQRVALEAALAQVPGEARARVCAGARVGCAGAPLVKCRRADSCHVPHKR